MILQLKFNNPIQKNKLNNRKIQNSNQFRIKVKLTVK